MMGEMASDQITLRSLRSTILQMVFRAKEGHIPSAYSILEILYVLYKYCLRVDPKECKNPDRDYFMLSKGHAGAGLYAVLGHFGYFESELLTTYCQPGSLFGGHPDSCKVPGVEVSSGSLGHGIAMGIGAAMGLRLRGIDKKVVVVVGDGEMDEGSFWESMMMAKNQGLNNLIVIADCNGSQKYSYPFRILDILTSMEWGVKEVDGHDTELLREVLQPALLEPRDQPVFICARTIKGYGVKRFVGEHAWHRRTPTELELAEILKELE